jgi:hypothetical protein
MPTATLLCWRMWFTDARLTGTLPPRGWLAQVSLRGVTELTRLRTDRDLRSEGGRRWLDPVKFLIRRLGDGVGIYIFLENCFERHGQYLEARLIDTAIHLELYHVVRPDFPRSVQSLGIEQGLVMTNYKTIIFKNSF